MIPDVADLTAIALQVGTYVREIGPFIIFGAVAAAAQVTFFGRRSGPLSGDRLIAPIATIPLGIVPMLAAALRSALIFRTSDIPVEDEGAGQPGILRRALSAIEHIIFPFIAAAVIGGALIVLTPTEPLWTLLSADGPWRLLIAPLIAGMLRPRGGSELPLVMAMITKGLDPAGVIAALAGSGYRHARTLPLAMLHLGVGILAGALFWITGLA